MRSDDTGARGACLAVAKVAAVSDGSPTMTAPRSVTATRYVTPLREGGSMPGLVEADDDGLYVLKFRGAGQGPRALVAELVAGELGRALGLDVPEIVLIDLDAGLGRAEPDPEIQELIARQRRAQRRPRLPARRRCRSSPARATRRARTSPPRSSGSTRS